MKDKETNRALHRVRLGFAEGVQGLREARKRSLLGVNEHFEPERNAEITRKAQPEGKVKDKQTIEQQNIYKYETCRQIRTTRD